MIKILHDLNSDQKQSRLVPFYYKFLPIWKDKKTEAYFISLKYPQTNRLYNLNLVNLHIPCPRTGFRRVSEPSNCVKLKPLQSEVQFLFLTTCLELILSHWLSPPHLPQHSSTNQLKSARIYTTLQRTKNYWPSWFITTHC